jgi:hypothetical protein
MAEAFRPSFRSSVALAHEPAERAARSCSRSVCRFCGPARAVHPCRICCSPVAGQCTACGHCDSGYEPPHISADLSRRIQIRPVPASLPVARGSPSTDEPWRANPRCLGADGAGSRALRHGSGARRIPGRGRVVATEDMEAPQGPPGEVRVQGRLCLRPTGLLPERQRNRTLNLGCQRRSAPEQSPCANTGASTAR